MQVPYQLHHPTLLTQFEIIGPSHFVFDVSKHFFYFNAIFEVILFFGINIPNCLQAKMKAIHRHHVVRNN